ncbi:MAG: CDGSH iron-sulfur domain-containing protein [Actinomycetota bacterium]|nr:CDGSH iron-sulfur domain-containing protein [Actinomycetota bacterium]
MLVRGAQTVQDSDGQVHTSERPVVALCRCRKSARLPFCDGTHKLLPKDARP